MIVVPTIITSAASAQASSGQRVDALRFKNVKGFKVHEQRKSPKAGRYTKYRRDTTGHLRINKKKYNLTSQIIPQEANPPPLEAGDPCQWEDVEFGTIDNVPPGVDFGILGNESRRKQYASVSTEPMS